MIPEPTSMRERKCSQVKRGFRSLTATQTTLRLIAAARRFTEPLKTRSAQNRPAEMRQKRNGSGSAALGADDAGFHASRLVGEFPLALIATAWQVGKTLIQEEELLARAENEFFPAIHAFENPVGEFHRFHLASWERRLAIPIRSKYEA